MKNLRGIFITPRMQVIDSFLDFGVFGLYPNTLNRAAVIPLEEYVELLEIAEDRERLALLQLLSDKMKRNEIEDMDKAQVNKMLPREGEDGFFLK